MESRVAELEKTVRKITQDLSELSKSQAVQENDIAYTKDTVRKIDEKMDKMLEFQNRWRGGAALLFALGGLFAWIGNMLLEKIN